MSSQLSDWESFAVMIGGASGALTGLLFVAVSLNRDQILRHPGLRASAVQTLVLFVLPLVVAALMLIPEQPRWPFAVELLAVAAVTSAVLLRIQRGSEPEPERSTLADLVDRRETSLITVVFIVVTAVTFWIGHGGGLFWLAPAMIAALISGVLNAWLFLIGEMEETKPSAG